MRSFHIFSCFAAAGLFTLAGCAIVVVPNDGDVSFKTAFSRDTVVGDGQLRLEARPVSNLADLDIAGPVNMEVRVGPQASLQVETDANLMPLVRTEASGGTLRVRVEGNVRTNYAIRVIYTVPQLSQIRATGSGRLTVTDLNGGALSLTKLGSGRSQLSGKVGNLNMEVTGSGDVDASALQSGSANLSLTGSGGITLGQVRGELLNVKVRGSGDVRASGVANMLNARVTGSGAASLKDLTSQSADLSTDGSGDITARVQQSLVAQANGSGHITVYGNPGQRNVTGKNVQVLN
jgi:hypothetical protein